MSRPIAIPPRERYSISHDEVKTRKHAVNNHASMAQAAFGATPEV
jgi:hypothetical protein